MVARAPLGRVFALFEDPRNLARITPSSLKFEILNADSVQMRAGAEIDYKITVAGLRIKWKTVIVEYQPPFRFVDEQARGPYSCWHHEHSFRDTSEGVVIQDRVDYELPLGYIGRMVHSLAVRRRLLSIFRFRQRAIAGMLEGAQVTFDDPVITPLR